jgi:2',3'-cyclic-nucleotide 2'-phosphodiesterase (5'-nucleotidase family)
MIWLLLLSCARQGGPAEASALSGANHLVIAHTNDLHTYYVPTRVEAGGQEELWGGFGRIDGFIDELRATHGDDDVLYLDGGDLLTGTPLMEFEHRGVQGGAMIDFIEAVGCDAMVLGNHEFDRGIDNVAALVATSSVPILSANLVQAADPSQPAVPGLLAHVILEAAGETVGVFGLTTVDLPSIINPAVLDGLEVRDPVAVAREQVALLEGRVDRIVALTHIGLPADRDLAERVAGIDLIVGGHSHTAMESAERAGDTWIVQAGEYARNVGVAQSLVGQDEEWLWKRVDLVEAGPSPSEEVQSLVEHWDGKVVARFEEPVGTLAGGLRRAEPGESSMGRWASDLVRVAASADIGIYNRGGLRADLSAGPLTLLDLYRVFPFGNEVVSFLWTGEQLERVVEGGLHGELGGDPSPLQWSGITYRWTVRDDAPVLLSLSVGGEPVDPGSEYRVATNVFVSWQWENLLGEAPLGPIEGHGLTVFEAAEQSVRAGEVRVPADKRSLRISAP